MLRKASLRKVPGIAPLWKKVGWPEEGAGGFRKRVGVGHKLYLYYDKKTKTDEQIYVPANKIGQISVQHNTIKMSNYRPINGTHDYVLFKPIFCK